VHPASRQKLNIVFVSLNKSKFRQFSDINGLKIDFGM
jgi:hypothetical protein